MFCWNVEEGKSNTSNSVLQNNSVLDIYILF
nr:MAG TPA: hypothetical protein [Caudoviricetes sp.]